MADPTLNRRPALSPRELSAFQNLLRFDGPAAIALCFPDAAKPADRERALKALETARAADAASNDGYGNRFSWAYAAWLARETVECGVQREVA